MRIKMQNKNGITAAILQLALTAALAVCLCMAGCAEENAPPAACIIPNELELLQGEQMTAEAHIASGSDAVWSSNDEDIAVCENGVVTALKSGSTEITLKCGEAVDSVIVRVTGSVADEGEALVKSLAAEGGDVGQINTLLERMERCAEDSSDIAALLKALAGCTAEKADGDALRRAAAASGMDEQVCLNAAAYCWAAGEQMRHDAVLSFVGDCTLARCNEGKGEYFFDSVYSAQNSVSYPFDGVRSVFLNDSLTVINFEGVLTEETEHAEKAFYFRGDPEYARILPASGIEAATLANNHSMDYFAAGYEDTHRYLSAEGVALCDEGEEAVCSVKTAGGKDIRVVLMAFNFIGAPRVKIDEETARTIEKYKSQPDTVVIANMHWGIEYDTVPDGGQQTFARGLIDAGVDLVVGHHPHIIQGIECYNGRYIAYSLGNFAFGGNTIASRPESLILRAAVDIVGGRAEISGISVIPCSITSSGGIENNYRPRMLFGDEAQAAADILLRRSARLKYGVEELVRSGI